MSIVTHWQQLPRTITHAGYTFGLDIRPFGRCLYVGYFLLRCNSRQRDKLTAFGLGFWTDKRPRCHTSSVETPLLTGVPLFSDDDAELERSLQTLHRYLMQNFGYTQCISDEAAIFDAQFEEIPPQYLT